MSSSQFSPVTTFKNIEKRKVKTPQSLLTSLLWRNEEFLGDLFLTECSMKMLLNHLENPKQSSILVFIRKSHPYSYTIN